MSLANCADKSEIVRGHQRHKTDTGSPEVQIALLTKRLDGLSKHFESHPLDEHSRRGLMKIVSQRKRLLSYLRRESPPRYKDTLDKLGLRK